MPCEPAHKRQTLYRRVKFVSSDPTLLRQRGLRRRSRTFSTSEAPPRVYSPSVSRSCLDHDCRPKSRRAGLRAPYRHAGKDQAEVFFLDGMTSSDARAGMIRRTPAAPIYDLLRLQAVGDEQRQRHDIQPAGSHSSERCSQCRLLSLLSGTWRTANRERFADDWARHQRPRLQHRPRLPQSAPADAPSISRREFIRELQRRAARRARRDDQGFRRRPFARGPGGPFAGHHRPRHGGLLEVRRRARGRRHAR